MPIEDVDYLRQNSSKQSYMFMVDSGDRDHIVFPTPSTYTITFDVPFHNVIGFEVIDASIPRTMYNVDGGDPLYPTKNTVAFFIYDRDITAIDPSTYTVASVDPGDYTIQTLMATINSGVLQMHVNGDKAKPLVQISVSSVTNPPDIKNILRFSCPYPFVLDMYTSTMSETLGFDLTTSPSEASRSAADQRYTTFVPTQMSKLSSLVSNDRLHLQKLYKSVDLDPSLGLGPTNILYSGPRGIALKLPVTSTNYVAQSFRVPYKCYLTDVAAALSTSTGVVSGQIKWALYKDKEGTPGSPGSLVPLANTNGFIDVNYTDGGLSPTLSTSTTNATMVYATLEAGIYWIVFKGSMPSSPSQATSIYYNDVPLFQGNAAGANMLISNDGGASYDPVPVNLTDAQFIVSAQVTAQDAYHMVTAPGIYSLIGEKYTILRCQEIEENSYRSLAFTKHCLGLAKFKLGVVGYSENRVDFSKVPLREFHPIGKLSKLTFRFETASGLLYDFKGVNHHITYAIHYLEPYQKQTFEHSILNPNYTGNLIKDLDNEAEEDSDDQEYEYSEDTKFQEAYKARERRHLSDNITRLDMEAMQRFALGEDEDED